MLDLDDNAVLVAAGLVIGHLFSYGRKVKSRQKITLSDISGDLMQTGAMFVGAMSFLNLMSVIGVQPTDTWQTVMVTILFGMSFENYFQKARAAFEARMGMVAGALVGKLPDDAIMKIEGGAPVPKAIEVDVPDPEPQEDKKRMIGKALKRHYGGGVEEELPDDLKNTLDKLK